MRDLPLLPETPATALVLSGGGARAAYQVGVLQAISEIRREQNQHFGASVLLFYHSSAHSDMPGGGDLGRTVLARHCDTRRLEASM